MRFIIFPYKMGSQSAKALSQAIHEDGKQVLRVYPNRNYRPRRKDVIINWGASTAPRWDYQRMINQPEAVACASNKLKTFQMLQGNVETVDWTDSRGVAESWQDEGHRVFARTTIISHSGRGIVVAGSDEELVDAPLYTKAFNKLNEYRVHVFSDNVIDIQEKKKRSNTGGRDGIDVWNHGNDFVFARNEVVADASVTLSAIAAVKALGLNFGAVDIGWNGVQAKVFEVNTACGLEGSTVRKYVKAFYEMV